MVTIQDALQTQAASAHAKTQLLRAPIRLFISGMLAGAYIGVGVVLMVSAAGPLIAAGDGMAKLVAGLVFGVALSIVVFAGGELATSAMMILPQGVAMRSVSVGKAAMALLAVFIANLLGSFVFAALVVTSGVLHSNAAAGEMLTSMLEAKGHETPLELFTRGVLCNALVCLAIWMGARVRSEIARIVLIFAAITAFITSGFEHVVANMTTYAIGILAGHPHASWALFGGNLLWVGLGNLIGGGLIVGLGYWAIGGRPSVERGVESEASVERAEISGTG